MKAKLVTIKVVDLTIVYSSNNSYSSLLNKRKGLYYSAGKTPNNPRNITLHSKINTHIGPVPYPTPDCSSTIFYLEESSINLTAPISQTWSINEGPFLTDICGGNLETVDTCVGNLDTVLAKNPNINISFDGSNNSLLHSLANWNSRDKLRQFKFL